MSITQSIHCNPIDMFLWFYFKPYRTIDTAKQPPVSFTLGSIYRFIGRMLTDAYFQPVLAPKIQEPGYIIGETIKTSLMNRSCYTIVHQNFSISHYPIKNDLHCLSGIFLRYLKRVSVNSSFHTRILHPFFFVPPSVGISTKAL